MATIPPSVSVAGAPDKRIFIVPLVAVGTAGNDLTTPVFVAPRTGYITKVQLLPLATYTGAATNYRQWNVICPSTRQVTDGVTTSGGFTLTSATAAFTQDDVDKTISGTGLAASSKIVTVVSATTVVLDKAMTVTNTGVTVTIGASRTLATLDAVSGQNLAAGTPKALVLSTTDTKVYAGDLVTLQSLHIGTGLADPGSTLQIEFTAYGEGAG